MTTRSVALLVLVAIVGLTVAPFTGGAVVATLANDGSEQTSNSSNASVSTFMQASAADTENTVDAEMFARRYNASDNESRQSLVLERTDELDERLETLEAERASLRDSKDELHRGEYQARMAQLAVEIRSIEREIDRTEQRANESGVDAAKLDRLRSNAANLSGPEVAEIARGLAGMDEPPGRGPPDDRPGNGPPAERGNETAGGPDQGNGNPPGQGNENVPGQGNGSAPGQGNADRGPGGDAGGSGSSPDEQAADDADSETDSDDATDEGDSSAEGSATDSSAA